MRTRIGAILITAAGLAMVAAACGGSTGIHVAQLGTTTAGSNSIGNASARSAHRAGPAAFARCMRADGVPRYPDPTSSGQLVKESLQQLGVSAAHFYGAERRCQHLFPNGGRPTNQAEQRQINANALRFARCVRAHGVANFPDPGSDGRIPDPATVGIDQGSPKFQAANNACARYRPPYMPSNGSYNSWARTHG